MPILFIKFLNLLVHALFIFFMESTVLILGNLEVSEVVFKLIHSDLAILDIVL